MNHIKSKVRRFAAFVLAIATGFALETTVYASETSITVKVTYTATLVSNNHVGEDWNNSYTVTYNGEVYEVPRSGVEIEIEPGDTITMTADIEETDDARPDCASGYWDLTFSDSGLGAYGEETMEITVTEDGGQYKGNTATWQVYWYAEVVETPESKAEKEAEEEARNRAAQSEEEKFAANATANKKKQDLPQAPGQTVFVYGTKSTIYHTTSYCPDRGDGELSLYTYNNAIAKGLTPCETCVDTSADSYRETEIPKASRPTPQINLELIVIIALTLLFAIYFIYSMRKTRAQAREIQLLRKLLKTQEEEIAGIAEEGPEDSE